MVILKPIHTIRFVAYDSYSRICDRVNTRKKRQISPSANVFIRQSKNYMRQITSCRFLNLKNEAIEWKERDTSKFKSYKLMARFILETDDPSRRIIRLTDHPSEYKHKTNYPDELGKKIVRLVTRPCINAGKQTDHPSRRTTRANSSEQTNYADSSS